MAIDTICPHCRKQYRLKDELAGKTVTCREAGCRKVFAVTAFTPAAARGNGTAKPKPAAAVDAEALAAELFAEDAADKAPPGVERQVAVECYNCNHKWTEPESKAGKFALCPECRTRTKVPELKAKKVADWRDATGGRRLAERGPDLPKDLADQQMTGVSIDALKQAGAIEEPEVEPRPLKQKLMFAGLGVLLLAGIVGGGFWFVNSRSAGQHMQLMATAVGEVAEIKPDGPFPKGQPPLLRAALHLPAGEYHARLDTEGGLKDALKHFGDARQDLENAPPSLDRDALLAELAVAVLATGGDNEQVKAKTRIPWSPQSVNNNQPGNAATRFVQVELRQLLTGMLTHGVDPEVRLFALRQLAREFAKRGNPDVLTEVFTQGFADAEKQEAEAQMLLEVLLAGGPADKVKTQAEALKAAVVAGGGNAPPSAFALFHKAGVSMDGVKPLPPLQGRPDPKTATAYVSDLAVQDKADDALKLAGLFPIDERLTLLATLAHIAADPKPALEAAAAGVKAEGKNLTREQRWAAVALWRLARAASAAGQPENADLFAKAIPDDGLREWASAEVLRAKWAAGKAAATDSPKPESAAKARVGTAWACVQFARHNAAVTGKNDAATYDGWGKGELRGFGYAGLALGLQDRK